MRSPCRPALGVDYADGAAEDIARYADGYPYFLQEYGKIVWDEASADSPIDPGNRVLTVRPLVEAKLDGSFFRVRAERGPQLELQLPPGDGGAGAGPQKASDVAQAPRADRGAARPDRARGSSTRGCSTRRDTATPAFTVPQFDRYLKRAYPMDGRA